MGEMVVDGRDARNTFSQFLKIISQILCNDCEMALDVGGPNAHVTPDGANIPFGREPPQILLRGESAQLAFQLGDGHRLTQRRHLNIVEERKSCRRRFARDPRESVTPFASVQILPAPSATMLRNLPVRFAL